MNWSQAVAWTDGISYYDSIRNITYTDWRLPFAVNCTGIICPGSEMQHLFYNGFGGSNGNFDWTQNTGFQLFRNYELTGDYWSGTGDASSAFYAHLGFQMSANKEYPMFALAVRDGDVAPVPEPRTYTLLLLGLGIVTSAAKVHRKLYSSRPLA